MNCGTATTTVCLLQKLWHGHNSYVLWGCSAGTDPVTDYESKVGFKSCGIRDEIWGGIIFVTTRQETTRTSRTSLTDKP